MAKKIGTMGYKKFNKSKILRLHEVDGAKVEILVENIDLVETSLNY